MRRHQQVVRVEPASIPSSQPQSHSPLAEDSGVHLSLLVLPLLAVALVISATISLMFWRRKKTLDAVRRDESQHEHHELQSASPAHRAPPPPPSAFTPPSPSRRAIKTRNRSHSAPAPPSTLSSPSKAKFSPESIVAIDLRTSPPQSPAAESPKHYPTRPWDGSGEFPDTGGLVKDLQPFSGACESYY